jgi:polyhydroxyalkanoate synthesis repressor PhaR
LRRITRYPNRRLYDSEQGKYVNLAFIKCLINDNVQFEIINAKTNENVTRNVLLKIIQESEVNNSQSILTSLLLKKLIMFYDSGMESKIREYLQKTVTEMIEHQDLFMRMTKSFPKMPIEQMFSLQMTKYQKTLEAFNKKKF